MEFQVNTTKKEIKIVGDCKLVELVRIIKKTFPKEWKDYQVVSESVWKYYPFPYYIHDWNLGRSWYTMTGGTANSTDVADLVAHDSVLMYSTNNVVVENEAV